MENRYEGAKRRYEELGVDVEQALEKLGKVPVSIHCWQGMMSQDLRTAVKRFPEESRLPEIILGRLAILRN